MLFNESGKQVYTQAFSYVDAQLDEYFTRQPQMSHPKCAFSIVGLTATGKTDLAFALAEYMLQESPQSSRFKRVDIISADSRQVFKAIPLVSGADVPSTFVSEQVSQLPYPFYSDQVNANIHLHGIGILEATQEWSVSHFQTFAQQIMKYSWVNQGLVLLVGGTGLYHAHVFNDEMKTQPGPDLSLRKQVEQLSVDELQALVQQKNPSKWQVMNVSDRANPRRLIRALESNNEAVDVERGEISAPQKIKRINPNVYKSIMTHNDFEEISQKIAQRVQKRIELGAIQEVQELLSRFDDEQLSTGATASPAILTTTGVREIQQYLSDKIDLDQATQAWIAREIKYAKQQLTWWKSHTVDFNL